MPPRKNKQKKSSLERRVDRLADEQFEYERKQKAPPKKSGSTATAAAAATATTNTTSASTPNYTIDDVLAKAEELMSSCQFELAQSFLQKALTMEPENELALTLYGDFLLHGGDIDQAVQVLQKAIELNPNDGVVKYMNYAQAVGGDDGLLAYEKGIELLMQQLENEDDEEAVEELRAALCTAFCSVAELYLTDLCMVPEAETACGHAIAAALENNPTSPEALLLAASYKISCKQPDEAVELLKQSHEQWREIIVLAHREANEEYDADDDENVLTEEQLSSVPSYEHRLETARLYGELAQHQLCAEICEQLVDESDDIVDVWTVLTRAHLALEQLDDALECIQRAKQLLKIVVDPDPEIKQMVDQLHQEVASAAKNTQK